MAFSSYNTDESLEEVALSEVIQRANTGEISKIEVTGNALKITKTGEEEPTQESRKEAGASLLEQGLERTEDNSSLVVSVAEEDTSGQLWGNLLLSLIPVILIGGILFWMMRSAQGQGNQAMSFGRSKARLYGNEKQSVVF